MLKIPELNITAATEYGIRLQLEQHFQEQHPNQDITIDISDIAFVSVWINDKQKTFEYEIIKV